MLTLPDSTDDLTRWEREREDADRAYNDALTVLDGAIQRLREMPLPPPPYDEYQITPLNQRWELLPFKPAEGGGWLRRIRTHVWAMVAPLFERQQAFNSALVDHVNRNAAMHRETTGAIASTLSVCREELERLVNFQAKLILYAQQIVPYVDTRDRDIIDTKDRDVAGLRRELAAGFSELAARFPGLVAGLSGLSDELQKRWESLATRQQRHEAEINEVRSTLNVGQRAVQSFKRELEHRTATEGAVAAVPAAPRGSSPLDAYKYVGFEDEFRGSQHEIRERMAVYVSDFEGASGVLDVGCGRGEFLDLLRERGIAARGVDLNHEMAAICRERGLDAAADDALSYLLAQPDASLGGFFAAQVVEHLEPDYLMRLLEVAYHKLRPGSKIVLETVNPTCWYAFFNSYLRDFTHVRPLHPDTLRYLLVASGFQGVVVRYSAPCPDEWRLQPIPAADRRSASGETVLAEPSVEMAAAFNENVKKLNDLLFTYLDYAVIGERL